MTGLTEAIRSTNGPRSNTEWEKAENLSDFLKTPEFAGFRERIMPLAAGPAQPELYETDVAPWEWSASAAPGVVRIEPSASFDSVEQAWKTLKDSIKSRMEGVTFFSGRSVNLETQTFVCAMGWRNPQVYLNTCPTHNDWES